MTRYSATNLRLLSGWVALLLMLQAPAVWAQDDGVGDDEGGDMDFTMEEAEDAIPTGGLIVTGIILRADPDIGKPLAGRMTTVLMDSLDKLDAYQNIPNDALRQQFEQLGEQGAQDCLYNPVCLSRIGRELGLARMVVGRLGLNGRNYALSMDLINIEEGIVEEYISRTVDGGEDDLAVAVQKSIPRLFKIRTVRTGGGEVAELEIGPVQTALAWTAAGVGVLSLGAGVFFGLDASSIESDLEDSALINRGGVSVRSITQVEAQQQLDDAQSSALLANVFYGVALAAGTTSALLFFITPGSDIATEQELAGPSDITILPMVGPGGAGVQAGFTW